MRLFDTHAHLEDKQLLPQLDSLLATAAEAGVEGVVAVGTSLSSSRRSVELAERFPQIVAAVGIHPNSAQDATESDWRAIVEMAQNPQVVAIGETGLDQYWDHCPLELQRQWFAKHIELSFETGKPLVIHTRDCEIEMLDMLSSHLQNGKINGIMHSFAGSSNAAKRCLSWGMSISFSGILTYKNSVELRETAKKIPDERLLIETDAPYLSPHPHRSQRPNHPAMVHHTAECLAHARGVSVETLGDLTTDNARRLFRID